MSEWPVDPQLAEQHQRLEALLRAAKKPASEAATGWSDLSDAAGLTRTGALELFEDQLLSRELDAAARALRARNQGFYTIQSAGHEQNAILGRLLRTDDPCLLHYRSGALMLARARKAGTDDPIRDILLSLCASREDPIAMGRHKVWGSRPLWVIPQTSTIASHLPRAMGLAFALGRRGSEPPEAESSRLEPPTDAVVCCTFGDASAHHATALSGIHAARYASRRGTRTPVLFVCEDNGLGISVPTPRGWIQQTFGGLPHLHYVEARGDLPEIHARVREAIDLCREAGMPVFLRLPCVRLFGHAGSDVESGYRTPEEIEFDRQRDPLLANARWLLDTGLADPDELLELVTRAKRAVASRIADAASRPKLADRDEITAPLTRFDRARCAEQARDMRAAPESRAHCFAGALPEQATAPSRRTLASHLGSALHDAMLGCPDIWVFGEDVGRKGGVYHVTAGLQARFGMGRVFDTLLDETSILGVALGAGLVGALPVPEIQYLAYVHNALDQLRGEACSLAFFSAEQFRNPMLVRIASFAYQKGFGGHFHNDNSIGALRDIPGLMLVTPSRGDDAVRLLRAALAIARAEGRVVCFLEPIALYHEKDLYTTGDEAWLFDYPHEQDPLWPGEVGLYGDRGELLIVSYANGVRMALRAARTLKERHSLRARVLDLRWLAPLPFAALEAAVADADALLVADECRASGGGIADAVLAHFAERGLAKPMAAVRSSDSYVPLGPAAAHVLLSENDIVARALSLRERAQASRTSCSDGNRNSTS